MELKERKAIANGALPKFDLGLSNLPDEKTGLLKLENSMLKSGQFVPNSTGGLEPNMLAQKSGKAGAFLKNNAGGIMSIASGALDFVGTMNDISTNKISSDEMMGSGGTSNESANGISYQQSKVDEAGYQNKIDATAKAGTMAAMGKGAALGGAIGSVIPGLGTVAGGAIGGVIGGIAGLFGSSKAKREAKRQMRIAVDRTIASNTQNRETAYTTGLRNEFNRENITDTSQSLFHAALGKEKLEVNPVTGKTFQNTLRYTSHGPAIGPQGGWGTKGEVIADGLGYGYEIPTGPNDTAKIDVDEGDSIYSLHVKNPSTGNSVAHDAKILLRAGNGKMSISDKNWLDMNQQVGKMMMYAGKRKPHTNTGYLGGTLKKLSLGDENITDIWNKEADTLANNWYLPTNTNNLPKPAPVITSNPQVTTNPTTTTNTRTPGSKTPGFLSKLWGGIKNAGSGLDLGNIALLGNAYLTAAQRDARAEGLRAPKSFVANPYEQDALQQLNSLHSDYYPVWAQNRELEGRGKSSIMQSGGLSAGQKMLGYMGLTNQTQQNNASALFEHQGRENALRAQAAKASLEAGNQTATRQQQAYQWDEDMLAKAHAARENMLETSAYDRQNGLTQFFKNAWEKNQFDRTMNLYESQQKDDHAKIQAIINSLGTKNTPVTLNGVAGNAAMLQVDPTTGKFVRTNPYSASQLLSDDAKKSIDNQNNIISTATDAINGINTGAAPKIKRPEVSKSSPKKNTTSKQVTRKKITLAKDDMGKQFDNFVATPQKKESKKATIQAKPTEDVTTKSTLLSSIQAGGRNLVSLSSNKDISPYSVVKQEEHKLKSKVGKSNASAFMENVSEIASKAYEDGQKKRKAQLKNQPAKQESKAGKSNASSFFDALSKLYAEGQKKREKTLKEQRGY